MNKQREGVKALVAKYKQEHLLDFIDTLPEDWAENLLEQIRSIDFELMEGLYCDAVESRENNLFAKREVSPIHSDSLSAMEESTVKEYRETGMKVLSRGTAAAVTMAGGQGTRLGHSGPKGTFDIGLPSKKTLFHLQAERLTALSQQCGKWISWYIMTSHENHRETVQYFENNMYFGYPEEEINFFTQGRLPMLDTEGKILLKEKEEINFGPDGNGGVFLSLKKSGALEDMKKRGVRWVFICGVDNALVRMADPVFIGYAVHSNKAAASKSVRKKYPEERVGVFCRENGRPSMIEYTELPEEYVRKTGADGELLFGDANIIAHLFEMDVLLRIADRGLPYHTAFKKASYIDRRGTKVSPEEPNAYKFESFIFDAFQYLDDLAVLRVDRDREFAPVKNSTGEDSPENARKLMLAMEGEGVPIY